MGTSNVRGGGLGHPPVRQLCFCTQRRVLLTKNTHHLLFLCCQEPLKYDHTALFGPFQWPKGDGIGSITRRPMYYSASGAEIASPMLMWFAYAPCARCKVPVERARCWSTQRRRARTESATAAQQVQKKKPITPTKVSSKKGKGC